MNKKSYIQKEAIARGITPRKYIMTEMRDAITEKKKAIDISDIKYREVRDDNTMKKLLRFRKKILVDLEGWDAAHEPDKWDDLAIHFAAFYKRKVVGCIRVIDGSKKDVLEEFLQKGILDRGDHVIECSRLALHPLFRINIMFVGLFNLIKGYARGSKVNLAYLLCWRDHERIYFPWGFEKVNQKKIMVIDELKGKVSVLRVSMDDFVNSRKWKYYQKRHV